MINPASLPPLTFFNLLSAWRINMNCPRLFNISDPTTKILRLSDFEGNISLALCTWNSGSFVFWTKSGLKRGRHSLCEMISYHHVPHQNSNKNHHPHHCPQQLLGWLIGVLVAPQKLEKEPICSSISQNCYSAHWIQQPIPKLLIQSFYHFFF